MKLLLSNLYKGNSLNFEESQILFEQMFSGKMDPVTITAILVALKVKGEQASEVAGLVKFIRSVAQPFENPQGLYADCCGTGGDGFNTFNVSTASAFVAAECGLPIIKHGNRSVSSRCGSADIIEAMGIDLQSNPQTARQCFDANQYCFLFAPEYHPLMAHVGGVRKQLSTSTIFNLAGPLANPAAPPVQLMGVCREDLCLPLAEVLLQLKCKRGLVVHGAGLDEIALHHKTTAVMVDDGNIRHLTITPEMAGLTTQPLAAVQLKQNDDPIEIFINIMQGKGTQAMTDMVALNTGTLLWLAGKHDSIKLATSMAKQAILDGAVSNKLSAVQEFYHG